MAPCSMPLASDMGPMTEDCTFNKVFLEACLLAIYRIDGVLWATEKMFLMICSLRAELKVDPLSR